MRQPVGSEPGLLADGRVDARLSVSSAGGEGDDRSALPDGAGKYLSDDGRYVTFYSRATNLVASDTNGAWDTFRHDRDTGTTVRISVDSSGNQANSDSLPCGISADGNLIAFFSEAENLVASDLNATSDVFVRDVSAGTTERVSVDSSGGEGDGGSSECSISADGRYLTFGSSASNLVANDTNGVTDVFLHDLSTGDTTRVSLDAGGGEADGDSYGPVISADGSTVAFYSYADNLVTGDTTDDVDVYVVDLGTGTPTKIASETGYGYSADPVLSDDGRFVAFEAEQFVDDASGSQIYVHDRQSSITTRIAASADDSQYASISGDGRFVVFESDGELVTPDTNYSSDVFAYDRTTGTTTRVSVNLSGAEGNSASYNASISADGTYIAFDSLASNLIADDTNATFDVFGLAWSPPTVLTRDFSFGTSASAHANKLVRFEAEPVNTATGNYVTQTTDLSLPGVGLPFAFTRTYNSQNTTWGGPLGTGWSHSYQPHLTTYDLGAARFTAEDGSQIVFPPDGAGGYLVPLASYSRLEQLPDETYTLTRRDQVVYHFDATGVLQSETDRNGNALTFAYTDGQLTQVTDTVGREITLDYNLDGRLTTITDPLDRTVSYTYNVFGLLATVTDLRGEVTTYTYDSADRLETIVDANDHAVVANEYDSNGRVVSQTNALDQVSTFDWDPETETATYTDANDGEWIDVYAGNVLQSHTDPLGDTTSYAYDDRLNLTGVTDPRDNTTTFEYDSAGNLLSRTAPDPLAYEETWTYTALNDVETYTDGRDHTTEYFYDSAGNLVEINAPGDVLTAFDRDPGGTGLLVATTDPRSKTTTFDYDADGNLAEIVTPLGNTTTMTYDQAGRLLSSVGPRGNETGADPEDFTTSFNYDDGDLLLTTTDPVGTVTERTYDPVRNLLTVTDANEHTTTYGYDAANHLTSVTDADDAETAYTYDDVGNLISRVDANDHTTTFAYDAANRLLTTTDPLDHAWTLTYDEAGNVETRTDANAQATTYTYDELNRLVAIDYASSSTPSVDFAYDANGNRTSMSDGAGTEEYTYDALDRLTEVARGADTFGYGYDDAGNITSRTYPGQSAQSWTYDDDGRLASANGASYSYDASGNLVSAETPDGLTATYSYDPAGRLLEVAHTDGSDTLSRFTYGLDDVGNRVAMTTRDGTVTYRYDALNRLTEACWSPTSCPGGSPASPQACLACVGGLVTRPSASVTPPSGESYRTYTYDAIGNRLTETSNAGTTTYAYDDADRLTSVTPPGASAISYSFDDNGNQTAAGAAAFDYDLADRLVSASVGSTTETYTYAGDGTRLSASTGTDPEDTTQFLWDRAFGLPQLALERDGDDTLLRTYTYGVGRISESEHVLSLLPPPLPPVEVVTTTYYHHDGLGSVSDVTSTLGTSLAWSEYYPYGLVRLAGSSLGSPSVQAFAFTGEQLDATTDLYHLRARQYDPTSGRFLTTDPVAPSADDPYVSAFIYGNDNPALLTDPSGRCPLCVVAAVGGLVGGVVNTAVYAATNSDHLTLEGAAGAFAGGALAGAVTAVSLPASGLVAATAGARVAVAAALNFGGGFSGTALSGMISGKPASLDEAVASGALNAAGGYIANRFFPLRGYSSLSQGFVVPRTLRGLVNLSGVNTRALWAGATSGAAIGSASAFYPGLRDWLFGLGTNASGGSGK